MHEFLGWCNERECADNVRKLLARIGDGGAANDQKEAGGESEHAGTGLLWRKHQFEARLGKAKAQKRRDELARVQERRVVACWVWRVRRFKTTGLTAVHIYISER